MGYLITTVTGKEAHSYFSDSKDVDLIISKVKELHTQGDIVELKLVNIDYLNCGISLVK